MGVVGIEVGVGDNREDDWIEWGFSKIIFFEVINFF